MPSASAHRALFGLPPATGPRKLVWVQDDTHMYLPGVIAKEDGDMVQVEVGPERRLVSCSRVELGPGITRAESLQNHEDDMVKMDDVNDASILHNLRMRFAEDLIYTNIGTILVSVNPFKWMPWLYAPEVIADFQTIVPGELVKPHVFAIANAAIMGIRDDQASQAIIISGESGAGKTEATKKCLEFFAAASTTQSGMERKLLAANPLLESMGNAKTVRNNNSSRFGKWMEVHFDSKGTILACRILNYLLEKSRVVSQAKGERNYHIFYQLCALPSGHALRSELKLTGPDALHYARQGGDLSAAGIDDGKEFTELLEAADALEVEQPQLHDLFRLVAGVAHLGNVTCTSSDGDPSGPAQLASSADTNAAVQAVSALWGVTPAALESALTTKLIETRSERLQSPLNQEQAAAARDSLAKTVYGKAFNWLVKRVNKCMQADFSLSASVIGVLDIFGFEIFELNSFEQLCINYCNEKLQQHFNTHVFKAEEACYQSEGIDYSEVKFIDNQDVLNLIEGRKPRGILVTLDDEVRVPSGSDRGFLAKLNKDQSACPRYIMPTRKLRMGDDEFAVEHYAGRVKYNADGFLSKNKDELLLNLQELCQNASMSFLSGTLFPASSAASAGRDAARKVTQGGQFRRQLDDLMAILNNSQPHYIRCIKANHLKKPDIFDSETCLQQLRYSGVFEAVKIRQQGFPFRWSHEIFFKRYRMCALDKSMRGIIAAGTDWTAACRKLLADLTSQSPVIGKCQIGRTMVLYRAEPHRVLELMRDTTRDDAVRYCQRIFRGYRGRKLFWKLLAVRAQLAEATKQRNAEAMRKAIAMGEACWFQIRDLIPARALLKRLEEEEACIAKVRAVISRDPSDAFEEYDAVLKTARHLGLTSNSDVQTAEAKFATVRDRLRVRAQLNKAIERGDARGIEKALQEAKTREAEWGDVLNDERRSAAAAVLEQARAETEAVIALEKAMAAGGLAGEVGAVSTTGLEAAGLDLALTEASKIECRMLLTQETASTARIMRDVRNAFKAAQDDHADAAWQRVEAAVGAAVQLASAHKLVRVAWPEVRLAVDEVRDQRIRRRALQALGTGCLAGTPDNVQWDLLNPAPLEKLAAEAKAMEAARTAAAEAAATQGDVELDSDEEVEAMALISFERAHGEPVPGSLASLAPPPPVSAAAQQLYAVARIIAKLRRAAQEKDWAGVRRVANEAKSVTLPATAAQEVKLAQDVADDHAIVHAIRAALSRGFAEGSVGALDTDVIETEQLQAALDKGKSLGPKSATSRELMLVGGVVLRIRNAMQDDDFEELGPALKPLDGHDLKHLSGITKQELQLARWEYENTVMVDAMQSALGAGGPQGQIGALQLGAISVTELREALATTRQLVARTEEAQWLLEVCQAVMELRSALKARRWVDMQKLIVAVKALDDARATASTAGRAGAAARPSMTAGRQGSLVAAGRRRSTMSMAAGVFAPKALEGSMKGMVSGPAPALNNKSRRTSSVFAAGMGGGAGASAASGVAAIPESIDVKARTFKLPPPTLTEVQVVQWELDNYVIVSTLTAACSAHRPSGPVGELNAADADLDGLSLACDRAQALTPRTNNAKTLLASTAALVDLRRAASAGNQEALESHLGQLANRGAAAARAAIMDGVPAGNFVPPRDCGPPPDAQASVSSTMSAASRGDSSGQEHRDAQGRLIVHPAIVWETERYAVEVAYLQVLAGLNSALTSGGPAGHVGSLDVSAVHTQALVKAVDVAKELGCTTDKLRHLQALARLLWQLRSALLDRDWLGVESLLEAARQITGVAAPLPPGCEVPSQVLSELELLRGEVDNRKIVAALKSALTSGRPQGEIGHLELTSISVDPLQESLVTAFALGPRTPEARCLVASAVHMRSMRIALLSGDWDELGKLVIYAQAVARRRGPPGRRTPSTQNPVPGGAMGSWATADEYIAAAAAAAARAEADAVETAAVSAPFDLWWDGLAADALPEVEVMQAELDNRNIIVHIAEALRSGMAAGTVGNVDTSAVDLSALDWAINFADKVGCNTVEAQQMSATARVVRRVRQALLDRNWAQLEQVLVDAHGQVLADIVEPEIRLAQDELDNRAILTELSSALVAGAAAGPPGAVRVDGIQTAPLADAIALAGRLGCKTDSAKQMLFTAKVVARLRHCLLTGDYNEAALTLDAVRGKKLATLAIEEVTTVQNEVDNWIVVTGLRSACTTGYAAGTVGDLATDTIELESLRRELQRAKDVGVKTDEAEQLVVTATALLRMRSALLDGDFSEVREVLEAVADVSVLPEAMAELQLVRDEMADREQTALLAAALADGGPEGELGALDTSLMDTSLLDRAIASTTDAGAKTPAASRLLSAAKLIRRLRAVLREDNWEWVGSVLADAREHRDDFPVSSLQELQLVQDELDNRSILAAVASALETGGPLGKPGDMNASTVDVSGLDAAISYARTLGCKTMEAAQMVATAQLVRRLRQAVLANDWAFARELLESVRGKVLSSIAAEEVQLVKHHVDDWQVLQSLQRALAGGAAQGEVAELDASSVVVSALDDAISDAMRLGCHTEKARRWLLSALLVRRLRAALLEGDWDFVAQVGKEAESEGSAVLPEALSEIDRALTERKAREVLRELATACEGTDEQRLAGALKEAAMLALDVHENADVVATVNAAQAKLESVRAVKAALQAALREKTQALLASALAGAGALGYTGELVEQGQHWLKRVQDLNVSAQAALEAMDRLAMERVVKECQADGVTPPVLKAVKTALSLPKHEFLRRELAAAVARRDTERVVDLTIELKGLFFEDELKQSPGAGRAAQFELARFHGLKPSALYAQAGGDASTMMVWQSEPLVTTLTRIEDATVRRLGVKMFRNILAFMGDRLMAKPLVLAQESMEMALAYPSLRDEALLQVCKQLTQCPNPASAARGWVLLEQLLVCFPPSEDAENYVEFFLRAQSASRCVRALHRGLYMGARTEPLGLSSIDAALKQANAPELPSAPPAVAAAASAAPPAPAPAGASTVGTASSATLPESKSSVPAVSPVRSSTGARAPPAPAAGATPARAEVKSYRDVSDRLAQLKASMSY